MEHALSRHLAGKFDSATVYPEVFPIERDDLVVSLGNGNGEHLFAYNENYGRFIGIEILGYKNRAALELAKQSKLKYDFTAITGDITAIPLASETCDKALAISVIEHVPDEPFLKEVHRVLKSDGKLLITFPAMHDYYIWLGVWFKKNVARMKTKGPYHWEDAYAHSCTEWIEMVKSHGFVLRMSRATTMFPPLQTLGVPRFWFSNKMVHTVDSFLCGIPLVKYFGQTLMCVFEKKFSR
jgi:SAM-dependent methyltransferase